MSYFTTAFDLANCVLLLFVVLLVPMVCAPFVPLALFAAMLRDEGVDTPERSEPTCEERKIHKSADPYSDLEREYFPWSYERRKWEKPGPSRFDTEPHWILHNKVRLGLIAAFGRPREEPLVKEISWRAYIAETTIWKATLGSRWLRYTMLILLAIFQVAVVVMTCRGLHYLRVFLGWVIPLFLELSREMIPLTALTVLEAAQLFIRSAEQLAQLMFHACYIAARNCLLITYHSGDYLAAGSIIGALIQLFIEWKNEPVIPDQDEELTRAIREQYQLVTEQRSHQCLGHFIGPLQEWEWGYYDWEFPLSPDGESTNRTIPKEVPLPEEEREEPPVSTLRRIWRSPSNLLKGALVISQVKRMWRSPNNLLNGIIIARTVVRLWRSPRNMVRLVIEAQARSAGYLLGATSVAPKPEPESKPKSKASPRRPRPSFRRSVRQEAESCPSLRRSMQEKKVEFPPSLRSSTQEEAKSPTRPRSSMQDEAQSPPSPAIPQWPPARKRPDLSKDALTALLYSRAEGPGAYPARYEVNRRTTAWPWRRRGKLLP